MYLPVKMLDFRWGVENKSKPVLFSNSPEIESPVNIAPESIIKRLTNPRLLAAKPFAVSA